MSREFMKVFGVVFLVLFLIRQGRGVVVNAADDAKLEKEYVVTLDRSNLTEFVSKHDFIVVEFYAPWCGHCKNLAPEYEKAAATLSKHDPPITLAKVDASDESSKELREEFKVQGFPTIKILRNGGKASQEYKGPREADGIVSYLKKQLGPASVEIKSAADAANNIDPKKLFVVGLFPKFSGEEYNKFTKIAEKLRSEYDFAHTLDAKYLPKEQSTPVDKPTIRLLKPFDEPFVDIHEFKLKAVQKFIEENSIPSVTVFDNEPANQDYISKYFSNENHKAMLYVDFNSDKINAYKSKIQDLATLFRDQNISFLIGDLEPSNGALQYFGLREDQAPLIIVQKKDDKKYLKAHVEPEEIVPWFKKYLDGKLETYKKKQPIPETNDEPVKVVVADTLDEWVLSSKKNVFLEFYAPWCGFCKKLAPILEEVGVHYEKDPNVVIAKFDATLNDVTSDKFKVTGFPTMYFKSANGNIVQFFDGRSKEEIVEFIEKHRYDPAGSAKKNAGKKKHSSVKNEDAEKDEL